MFGNFVYRDVCVFVCVRACVRACVRSFVRACVRACVREFHILFKLNVTRSEAKEMAFCVDCLSQVLNSENITSICKYYVYCIS